MPRSNDWQDEVADAKRREAWSLTGPNRPVKVVPLFELPRGARPLVPESGMTPAGCAYGFFTVAKYLARKTPAEIEGMLGLRVGDLRDGALIYRFMRLPLLHEYEYELTAFFPDGLTYNAAQFDEQYLPGGASVHQWRLKEGVGVPVDAMGVVRLAPGERFRLDWSECTAHGSSGRQATDVECGANFSE